MEDKKTVIVLPNSWKNIYTAAVSLCNRFNVSDRNIHAICMEVPASIYQLPKNTGCVSGDMACPIEPMDLIAF